MEELQLEETQRTNQQAQDPSIHDPNAASRFTEGYTPVGEGRDNTLVEQANPVVVDEIEATAGINSDLGINTPEDLSSGGADSRVFNKTPEQNEVDSRIAPVQSPRAQDVNAGDLPNITNIPDGVSDNPENPDRQVPEQTIIAPTPSPEPAPSQVEPSTNPQPPTSSAPNPEPPTEPPAPPEPPVLPPDPPEPPVDPEEPEVPDPEDPEPPIDPPQPPPEPPVDPEEPEQPDPEDPEPPIDPPPPPPEPPVDPEEPEEPDPEDPEPPVDPPEPPVDPEDPEEPEPEGGGGNPGNDKDVGNSPWDGETGASDNPGKGNHQDGQDPEPNQPPGDSKNNGPDRDQDTPGEDNSGGGGDRGKPESHGNNGWGNGDQDAPGNSLTHNNAENDQTPSGHTADLVDKFLNDFPTDETIATYNWEFDNDDYLDYKDEYITPDDFVELHVVDFPIDHHHDVPTHHEYMVS